MSDSQISSGLVGAVQVVIDSAKTNFGGAIIFLVALGFALVALAFGFADLSPEQRFYLMIIIIVMMFVTLAALAVLRLWKPIGLTGPPQPETKDVTITDSRIDP